MTVVLLAAMLATAGMAAAASRSGAPRACTNWVHTTSPNAGTGDNNLYGVAATSASDAWAKRPLQPHADRALQRLSPPRSTESRADGSFGTRWRS